MPLIDTQAEHSEHPTALNAEGLLSTIQQILQYFSGNFLETFDALVTSDGATVTMSLERAGGGNLTMNFGQAQTTLKCAPDAREITLTPGDDDNPAHNYVFILRSTLELEVSTLDWPNDEHHIKIAYFYVPSASDTQTNGVRINQNWNDPPADAIGQGHMLHQAERSRRLGFGATYRSGCLGTATQDGNALYVDVEEGVLSQAHRHVFDAVNSNPGRGGDIILVANDPDAAFTPINDLNDIEKLSNGDPITTNRYVIIVLWCVGNKTGETSPSMYVNVPNDDYTVLRDAMRDVQRVAVYAVPDAYTIESTTAFMVSSFICRKTATAMEIHGTIDLRGSIPGSAPGGGDFGGDVSAASTFTDEAIIRGDVTGTKDVQGSPVFIDDAGIVTGAANLVTADAVLDDFTVLIGKGGALGVQDTDVTILAGNSVRNVNTLYTDGDIYNNTTGLRKLAFSSGASAVNYIQVGAATTGNGPFLQPGSTVDANVDLRLLSRGTGQIRLDDEVLIGSITPTDKLQFRDPFVYINSPADGDMRIEADDAVKVNIGSGTDGFIIEMSNVEKARFHPTDGALLIGGTTPNTGALLQLGGDARNVAHVMEVHSTATRNNLMDFYRARGTKASPLEVTSADNTALLRFWQHNGTSFQVRARIHVSCTGADSAEIIVSTGAGGLSTAFTVNSAGDIVMAGDNEVQFGDSGQSIRRAASGFMGLKTGTEFLFDVGATREVEIGANVMRFQQPAGQFVWDWSDNANARLDLKNTSGSVIFSIDGSGFSFNNQTPATRPNYTITNPTTNRTINVAAITLAQLAQVVGTMIQDDINTGLYQ